VAALAGWAVLSMTDGGIDYGLIPASAGAAALAWGVVVAAALACAAVWHSHGRAWGAPAVLGVGAMAGLVAWSAASIAWAPALDRAWLATNRMGLGLAALVFGVAMTVGARDPARRLAIGLAAAGVPVLTWAIGSRVFPELLAPIDDKARLAAPIGLPNPLALLAVFVVPGALCLAADRRWRRQGAVILMAGLLVVAMTGSRSGILALLACLGLALWLQEDRAAMLTVLGAAVVGMIPATVYALGAAPLTQASFLPPPAERRGAGLLLGGLIAMGAVIAWAMCDTLAPLGRRAARWLARPAAGRAVLIGTGIVLAGGVVVAALLGRNAEPGVARGFSLDSNNRNAWWGDAWQGFLDAPVIGNGAGSFPLTHIAERAVADDRFLVRQPHQLGLELLSELGVVGLAIGLLVVAAVVWGVRRAGRAAGPALAIVVAFLIQAQLDIPWTVPAVSVPALVGAGVVMGLGARGAARRSLDGVRVAVTVGVAVAAATSALAVWQGERRATDAVFAADADPGRGADVARSAADNAWPAISPLLTEAKARFELGDSGGATSAAQRAVRRQPENPFAWECLAAVSTGALRAEALRRWTALDPRRDDAAPPACQPGW
jgi:O-Antigen ligase